MSDRFKPCHTLVNPELFRDNCIFDMCEYNGMEATLCDNVEAYAQACQSAGVTISWRNTTFCRKLSRQQLNLTKNKTEEELCTSITCVLLLPTALPCPPNSHYSDCTPPCPPTCADLFPVTCHLPPTTCVEGCQCDGGYVLSDGNCVPLDKCGCVDLDGEYHDVSEKEFILLSADESKMRPSSRIISIKDVDGPF